MPSWSPRSAPRLAGSQHGKSHVEDTRNLVVAKFRHETSREGDPQLHTHALVLKLTRRRDGEWRALHNDQIVKTTRYLGAVYRAELATELQRAGYPPAPRPRGLLRARPHRARPARGLQPSRRAHREPARGERPHARHRHLGPGPARGSIHAAAEGLDRRQALFAEWQTRAAALGIDFGKREPGFGRDAASDTPASSGEVDIGAQTAAEAARRGVRFAIAHLTERQAIIDERALLDVALKHAVGRAALRDIEREIDRLSASGYLIREDPLYRAADAMTRNAPRPRGAWVSVLTGRGVSREEARRRVEEALQEGRLVPAERRYTTQTALEREKRILQIERDGRGQVVPIASRDEVRQRLGTSDLTAGQRAAIELIGSTENRVAGVQGYAGTGKSHMLEGARALAEVRGYRFVALAPYSSQVRSLRELGIEARTLAAFLAAREKHLDPKTILVIDEAGTVPTRQMEQALKLAERADARVVLLGDTQQTKAIEAGRPFDQLQAAGMATAHMQEIQRQENEMLRRAVDLAAKGETARSLAAVGEVREIRDDRERRSSIARDYSQMTSDERARTIVVAGTNEARREINRAIREDLGLAGTGHEYSVLVRRDTTQAERTFAKNYAPGELIQPERDYPSVGLQRGTLYEVVETGPGNRLTVRDEHGTSIEFSPMSCRKLSVYEPERAELAAGDRVRITRNDAALDLANGDRFTVAAAHSREITLTDGRRTVALPAEKPLHLDHAYATTVHASQGTTAERVLIDLATKSRTTSQDVYYVAISRARHEARIYTDDAARLPAALAREHVKHAALDLERSR